MTTTVVVVLLTAGAVVGVVSARVIDYFGLSDRWLAIPVVVMGVIGALVAR